MSPISVCVNYIGKLEREVLFSNQRFNAFSGKHITRILISDTGTKVCVFVCVYVCVCVCVYVFPGFNIVQSGAVTLGMVSGAHQHYPGAYRFIMIKIYLQQKRAI